MKTTPDKGDRVVDKDRLINNEGEVIGFVYDQTDPGNEKIQDVSVRYSMAKTGVQWYTIDQFHWAGDHWEVGEEKEEVE